MTTATVQPHALPELSWVPTPNHSARHGAAIERVVVHRWGVKLGDEAAIYRGVIRYFQNPAPGGDTSRAVSAHVVYPGSAVPGEAAQMVTWDEKAWAEAHYNPSSVEVESADAIWTGRDPAGFQQLAHIVAWLLHHWKLPPRPISPPQVATERGFCRHGDLGLLGGNHPDCPTVNAELWGRFSLLVQREYRRGGFREHWGRTR